VVDVFEVNCGEKQIGNLIYDSPIDILWTELVSWLNRNGLEKIDEETYKEVVEIRGLKDFSEQELEQFEAKSLPFTQIKLGDNTEYSLRVDFW